MAASESFHFSRGPHQKSLSLFVCLSFFIMGSCVGCVPGYFRRLTVSSALLLPGTLSQSCAGELQYGQKNHCSNSRLSLIVQNHWIWNHIIGPFLTNVTEDSVSGKTLPSLRCCFPFHSPVLNEMTFSI